MRKKDFKSAIIIGVLILNALCFSCSDSKTEKRTAIKNTNYKIVHQKKFGLSIITMCYVKDTNEAVLVNNGKEIVGNNVYAFVFFYNDKSLIKDITKCKDGVDAMPVDGHIAEYTTIRGFSRNLKLYVVEEPKGPVEITLIESKTSIGKGTMKAKHRMYSYYVKNYTDTKETDNKMIETAMKLPVDNSYDAKIGFKRNGITEVFFFNNKDKAPKLSSDGGWSDNVSKDSWNKKYGKHCVGYYTVDISNKGEFSKGWK